MGAPYPVVWDLTLIEESEDSLCFWPSCPEVGLSSDKAGNRLALLLESPWPSIEKGMGQVEEVEILEWIIWGPHLTTFPWKAQQMLSLLEHHRQQGWC